MATITHLHSKARRFLLPIYGPDQAIFTAVLGALVIVGCLAVDPAATPYLAGGAMLGMWFMAGPHAPVLAEVSPSARNVIEEILDAQWKRSATPSCWVPRGPRWLRWGYVRICLEERTDRLIVTGPETNVRPLLAAAGQAT